MRAALLLALCAISTAAKAQPTEASAEVRTQVTHDHRDFVNLRGGVSTASRHAELCLEVSPVALVALEACGSGSGFLHDDPGAQIAHFRAKVNLRGFEWQSVALQPQLFAGFAELQAGEDDPGFQFFGAGPRGVETAGPEVGIGLRTLYALGAGFELVGTLNLSLAYFAYGAELAQPVTPLQPAASFTVGFGF